MQNQILNQNRKIFGSSSEQVDSNQLCIFDEAEKNSNLKVEEPTIEKITYTKKTSTNIGKKAMKNLNLCQQSYIEEHFTYSYGCKSCETENDKANIIWAKSPKTILHKSMGSNEILAHVINLKYVHAMPLYRQETCFKMLDVKLSRQTLSNCIMPVAHELEPVYDFMKKKLIKRDYIQTDETTLKVIDAKGSDTKS